MLSVTEMIVTVEIDETEIEEDREVDLEIGVEVDHQKEIDLGQDHVTEPEEEVTIKRLRDLTGTDWMTVSIPGNISRLSIYKTFQNITR